MSTTAINPTPSTTSNPAELVDFPPRLAPPSSWLNLDLFAYAVIPAEGGQTVILSFTVPAGFNGIINKIANNFVGGGWVEGSGVVTWAILVDGAPPAGAASYSNILGSLGNPSSPTQIAGFRIFAGQTIQVVVNNVGIAAPSGQMSGARLCGWTYPIAEETDDVMY